MKIALAGNPNSGKTTLFNAITGKTEYVGNWAGVTVEKMEANLRGRFRHMVVNGRVVDLPGAYSISPYTGEEAITRSFVMEEHPDVILNIVDAASLERSLFFTTQLMELGIPVVIALNKQDLVRRSGNRIDVDGLEKSLGCRIVPVIANEGDGLNSLMHAVAQSIGHEQHAPLFEGKTEEGEDNARQRFVKSLVAAHHTRSPDADGMTFGDRLDRILAHGILGLPIFALIMWGVYAFSIEGLGGYLSGWLSETLFGEVIPNATNGFFEQIGVHPLLQGLIVDGAIAGIGAVLGFLPLIMVLFFCLALLEDSGYMARVAVVMDRYFKKFGLSGKSIIPMIVGSGCSIPGVMATRTIENPNEKRITTMLTPFVPCSAKLPVIALFSAVFFPGTAWVAPSMYILAFGIIVTGGLLLKRLFVYDNPSSFIMELPAYRMPSLRHALRQMMRQARSFFIKASTIILVMNTIVWIMQRFDWGFRPVGDSSASMLAGMAGLIAPLFIPLGFFGWQLAAAAITGFIAKENVVATLAILLGLASQEALQTPGGSLAAFFTPVTAYAFLVFNLFIPPCFAAIGAMNTELGDKKWLGKAILFQFSVGYLIAMFVTQVGTLVFYGHVAAGALPALLIAVFAATFVLWGIHRADAQRSRIAVPVQ